jgi:hypothetical protein
MLLLKFKSKYVLQYVTVIHILCYAKSLPDGYLNSLSRETQGGEIFSKSVNCQIYIFGYIF